MTNEEIDLAIKKALNRISWHIDVTCYFKSYQIDVKFGFMMSQLEARSKRNKGFYKEIKWMGDSEEWIAQYPLTLVQAFIPNL